MNAKILIAIHKPYTVPSDSLYVPLQMGAEGKAPLYRQGNQVLAEPAAGTVKIEGDDGSRCGRIEEEDPAPAEQISAKNGGFCELTGLYYAWKNWTDADAIGLVHYRRYFGHPSLLMPEGFAFKSGEPLAGEGAFERILTGAETERLFSKCDIIVPQKRRYVIESLFTHYASTHDARHLVLARDIIAKEYTEYIPAVDQAYSRRWGYMFNMGVFKKDALDGYCSFLFPVLFELEKRLNEEGLTENLSPYEARLFGRVSEILFNAWLLKHREYRLLELPLVNTEPVNWAKKGKAFLEARFLGKKYEKSF